MLISISRQIKDPNFIIHHFKIYRPLPEFASSRGSNSDGSAHESVFQTAFEFEFVGLVII